MRIALTTALLLVAAMAWGEDSSSSETKTEASAEAAQAQPVEPVPVTDQTTEQTTEQAEQTTPATATMAEDKAFKVPAGYREKRVNGKVMYCSSRVTSGSRFGKDTCRTEAQLRAIERQKEAARSESNQ